MSREITWDILINEHKEDIRFVDDRVIRINTEESILREKIIEWNGKLWGFEYNVDISGRILDCRGLYEVMKFSKMLDDYRRID
jgi:hypothetical protein